jgi:hypothetical protein
MSGDMPAFNGDIYIKNKVIELRDKFNIKMCIETGTHQGNTTIELANIFEKVRTIEINVKYFQESQSKLRGKINVECLKGSSPIVMNKILKYIIQPVFFYLNAHWHNYSPLFDELKTIAHFNFNKSIISIHDFKVPDKDFGYDKFPDGREYEFSVIKKHIDDIYGKDKYEYCYNEKAAGSYRGIIFIMPKVVNVEKT